MHQKNILLHGGPPSDSSFHWMRKHQQEEATHDVSKECTLTHRSETSKVHSVHQPESGKI